MRNIINKKVVYTEEKCVRILYNMFSVVLMGTGWNGKYHVIMEDGESGDTKYGTMTAEDIKNTFDIEL